MRHPLYISILLAFLFFCAWPVMAQNAPVVHAGSGSTTPWAENPHGRSRLIAASPTVGNQLEIKAGLHFQMQPGWHIYWRTPGDAGLPPSIDWAGSDNVAAASIHWPIPHRFTAAGIETAGYTGEVVLPITVTLSGAGTQTILRAKVDYLTCAEICVPYTNHFELKLYPGAILWSEESDLMAMFAQYLPDNDGTRSFMDIKNVYVAGDKEKPVLEIHAYNANGFSKPDLFGETALPVTFGKPDVRLSAGSMGSAVFTLPIHADDPDVFKKLTGNAITLTLVDGDKGFEKTTMPVLKPSSFSWKLLVAMIGFGILGGLILNVMPCVLPVLSIKLMQIIKKHDFEKRGLRHSFLAAAAGIVASFLILASGLSLLKFTGNQIGWGIQFQQPWFLAFLGVVVAIFAANLWGLFEIRLPLWIANLGRMGGVSGDHNLGREFLMGAFAALLATPCSAPFLGTALGFALSQGYLSIFLIFTAIGFGMAIPYLAVAAYPAAVYALPKPGKWMVTVRRVLAVFLTITALWLFSILGMQLMGSMQRGGSGANHAGEKLTWQYFEPEKIPALVLQGKIVFVDITADWCLTCKVNKKLVLDTADIQKIMAAPDVVLMRGDWTKPNAAIGRYLESFGRYGIPFNAVYSKQNPAGQALPELLSESVVRKSFEQARQ